MLSQSLIIREAISADIHVLMNLIQLKAEFDGCPELVQATAEQLTQDLFEPPVLATVLLAEVEGEVVGFASYHRIYSTFLAKPGIWLDDLYLKEPFRYQGIGQQLIQRLCQVAHELGCGRIDWTVAVNNPPAIQFYEKMGATLQNQVRLCRLVESEIDRHACCNGLKS
ncbi:MAG: GNAT family N-acetyltransferase [Elainellaceae cyanobacterium]